MNNRLTSFLISTDDMNKNYHLITGLNHSQKHIDSVIKKSQLINGKFQIYPSPLGFKKAEGIEEILINNKIQFKKLNSEYINL